MFFIRKRSGHFLNPMGRCGKTISIGKKQFFVFCVLNSFCDPCFFTGFKFKINDCDFRVLMSKFLHDLQRLIFRMIVDQNNLKAWIALFKKLRYEFEKIMLFIFRTDYNRNTLRSFSSALRKKSRKTKSRDICIKPAVYKSNYYKTVKQKREERNQFFMIKKLFRWCSRLSHLAFYHTYRKLLQTY